MENIYRDALRTFRAPKAEIHPLINSKWSYKKSAKVNFEKIETIESESLTEKVKKLDTLDNFNVSGTSSVKPQEILNQIDIDAKEDIKTPQENLTFKVDNLKENYNLIYSSPYKESKNLELLTKKNIQVLFVTDDIEESYIESDTVPSIFTNYFSEEVASLFYKMTQAMKLDLKDLTITSSMINSSEQKESLLAEIYHYRPKLVMSLGAGPFMALTGNNTRLKDSHGKFFDLNVKKEEEFSCQLMPIFSPKLLQTAPNMKKTAWLDMQKAMDYLK